MTEPTDNPPVLYTHTENLYDLLYGPANPLGLTHVQRAIENAYARLLEQDEAAYRAWDEAGQFKTQVLLLPTSLNSVDPLDYNLVVLITLTEAVP